MVRVHEHALQHGPSAEEVAYAWQNAIRSRQRHGENDPPLWIAVGMKKAISEKARKEGTTISEIAREILTQALVG